MRSDGTSFRRVAGHIEISSSLQLLIISVPVVAGRDSMEIYGFLLVMYL